MNIYFSNLVGAISGLKVPTQPNNLYVCMSPVESKQQHVENNGLFLLALPFQKTIIDPPALLDCLFYQNIVFLLFINEPVLIEAP